MIEIIYLGSHVVGYSQIDEPSDKKLSGPMIRILKIVSGLILTLLSGFVVLIVYATVDDYKPAEKEILQSDNYGIPVIHDSSIIDILIWNIGYAGLDKDMDFFYDGGRSVFTSKEQFQRNMDGIKKFLTASDSVDIVMLQEIDVKSKRSFRLNEVMALHDEMKDFQLFYGKNYDVFFVPLPIRQPMGSVNSGLLSMTQYKPAQVERYSFPGNYTWPKRLFMLDRCFLVMRFPVSNGKQLLTINTHNEAFDDGSIRDTQMAYLKDFLISEFDKGNYVMVGGDWNQCPPEFKPDFVDEVFDSVNNKTISSNYLPPGWQWVYDPHMPTNRRTDRNYVKGETMTTLIDFFLLSPNIKPLVVKTNDLQFKHSDHQPVYLQIELQ